MPKIGDNYKAPADLLLGTRINTRVPKADQVRQRNEVDEILRRLRCQPGVVLADEVGMGKTYVALAVAHAVASQSARGPVIIMVPANLVDKWEQDLRAFCELYLRDRKPLRKELATRQQLRDAIFVRYGVARHSVDLMKLLDDPARERAQIIFLAQGAMGRQQTDIWVRLALIAEALRRHARGKARRLIKVKSHIHWFLGELLWAIGKERAHAWGDELWRELLRMTPESWREIYNGAVDRKERELTDDPVPKAVVRAIAGMDLSELAEALKDMPIRWSRNLSGRLDGVRHTLRAVENELWKQLLCQARWRSPLLVMDEAHHLKNPGTLLARQLQSADTEDVLRTGDGAMAHAFDRMLFLTATPFQLGHQELVRVLERFGDVRWDAAAFGDSDAFRDSLRQLGDALTDSQRAAIALQRSWDRLRPEDGDADIEAWWRRMLGLPRGKLTPHQRAVVDCYHAAKGRREEAENALRSWVVRHNKGDLWSGTEVPRRDRRDGAAIMGMDASSGVPVPHDQLLPFFLAARSAVTPGQDLLGEALSSSYEAFRLTRQDREASLDEQERPRADAYRLSHADWYLEEFDQAFREFSGGQHPKIRATVNRVVDLWEEGEKVLVFAFYRQTCRALRIHISGEIERRMMVLAEQRLREGNGRPAARNVEKLLRRIQDRYFDDPKLRGRQNLDRALARILNAHSTALNRTEVSAEQCDELIATMRRFLRVSTTLVRCFPIATFETMEPEEAVAQMLDEADASGISWRQKFQDYIGFLTGRCSIAERHLYIEAAREVTTRDIWVQTGGDSGDAREARGVLANIQEATGETHRDARARLMRAFNTPFFPDILVCSEVMGEGVDLQRFCRHVIHHDLAWNPSAIEQRTGRIDRLGCKAEGRHPIGVYLPYLAGTADERQYRVMSDREQWFRVVMGQDEVAKLITPDKTNQVPLPRAVSEELSFRLGLDDRRRTRRQRGRSKSP